VKNKANINHRGFDQNRRSAEALEADATGLREIEPLEQQIEENKK
jgi:hypothetical protein